MARYWFSGNCGVYHLFHFNLPTNIVHPLLGFGLQLKLYHIFNNSNVVGILLSLMYYAWHLFLTSADDPFSEMVHCLIELYIIVAAVDWVQNLEEKSHQNNISKGYLNQLICTHAPIYDFWHNVHETWKATSIVCTWKN